MQCLKEMERKEEENLSVSSFWAAAFPFLALLANVWEMLGR